MACPVREVEDKHEEDFMSETPQDPKQQPKRRSSKRAQAENVPASGDKRMQGISAKANPSSEKDAKKRKQLRFSERDLKPIEGISVNFSHHEVKGEIGTFVILPTDLLQVDFNYHRSDTIATNKIIRSIASNFDWRKFDPVKVTPFEDSYVVTDGWLRVSAAISIGERHVPCIVIECTPQEEASVFLDSNLRRALVNERNVWFANLAKGDIFTHQVRDFLDTIGVTVVRNSTGAVAGETPYPRCLEKAYGTFGTEILGIALKIIVQTGDGNPGMITPSMVYGICQSLKGHEDLFQKELAIYKKFEKVRLRDIDIWARAERNAHGGTLLSIVETRIKAILAPILH
jgi:hypothetical protein